MNRNVNTTLDLHAPEGSVAIAIRPAALVDKT